MKSIMVAVILFVASFCMAQPQYVVTDLGTLGGNSSYAAGINNSGQVVGWASTPDDISHAFLYSGGTMQNLWMPSNCIGSYANAINDNGWVVGYSITDSDGYRAFLYSGGVTRDIGTLGGAYGFAYGINNGGQVVGEARISSGWGHAFLWQSGSGMQDLGTIDGESCACAINESGEVAGYSYMYAFICTSGGTMQNLGSLGGPGNFINRAYGINNGGQVVGFADAPGFGFHAFRTAPNEPINPATDDLGTLGGRFSCANGINSSGQVVGYSEITGSTTSHAFLYSGSGPMRDLNNLISSSSGWTLGRATAMNDRGQIVGYGTTAAGKTHGFLLTPVGKCQAYQVQPPVCAPIERLAKWDGANWVPVMPGDLFSGNIHVLVHGWGPGLRTFADDGGKIWDADDPKNPAITNDQYSLLKNAADALTLRVPNDIVVAFNWLDMSATETDNPRTEPRKSRSNTDQAASYLTNALKSAGISAGDFTGKVQISGMSHGARIAALATKQLYNGGKAGDSVVVDQLTLYDSPEGVTGMAGANNELGSVLRGINIGRSSETTFVDNYPSFFGNRYTSSVDIVNVQLHPNYPVWDFYDNHVYPINWYVGASVFTSNLGIAWSPLVGDAYKTLSSDYEQDWANGNEFSLKDLSAGTDVPVEQRISLPLSAIFSEGSVAQIPGGVCLTEHSPAYWHTGFTKNPDDITIEFTYQFSNAGDGDQLTLWIDDQMRFVITGDLVGTDAMTTDVDISDLEAGSHILSVALNNYGDTNAIVDVTNFTMVSVPEPSSLFLLVAGIIFARKRK